MPTKRISSLPKDTFFEPHTEWISKGKAGVPHELGLRVCIGARKKGKKSKNDRYGSISPGF